LLGLILLAFALRVYRLPAQSLWYDEGVSWYLTRMSLPDLTAWTADDIQPPLYYYLLWPWVRLGGTSEYALRFLSVAFGTLTVALLWAAGRRLLGERAAWLGAVILTLSPLHVYYAQEARMYTLLTFLGLLSSYLLLRWLEVQSPSLRSPYVWAYVLTAVAALYTHYFAFFLLAAHALYVLALWLRQLRSEQPLKPGIPTSIAIALSILILYLPWLPFLVTRYGVDTSYWPGAPKAWEIARKLFIAFGLGETVPERAGTWLAIGYGIILLISVVALWRNTQYAVRNTQYAVRSTQHESRTAYCVLRKAHLVFLLLYLFVPIVLVLLLVQRTPKFNPRYAMLASPAFILLFASGLSCLIKSRITHHASRFTFYASRIIAAAALFVILTTSIYALNNWYQPYPVNQFNKADFRITAQVVANRIGPDETVLLSSGHMFPAWAYYYGWEGWERVPDIEILDVNAALDLSAGDELDRLLQGKDGTWLVRWQNEVTDPFDVLLLYLGTVGTQDDYGQFWHMELVHYSLPPDARFDLENFITQPAKADFGGQAQLLGMRQVSPTREWRPGQAIPDRVSLALPPDLPAGEYWIEVGLYDAGDPVLSRLPLGDGSGDRAVIPFSVEANDLE
jgi:4-amino-4-deoxy-L-arabinose transferase-like glycosyltransferase